MTTEVFHMDANGVHISVDRAVFADHKYATRNISAVSTVMDRGNRWPGRITLGIAFVLITAGFVIDSMPVMFLGAAAVLSGSLNLARKKSQYGLRIRTQRGPVYVLASSDKHYVEIVSGALQRAMSDARRATGQQAGNAREGASPKRLDEGPVESDHASDSQLGRRRRTPSGRPTRSRRRRR